MSVPLLGRYICPVITVGDIGDLPSVRIMDATEYKERKVVLKTTEYGGNIVVEIINKHFVLREDGCDTIFVADTIEELMKFAGSFLKAYFGIKPKEKKKDVKA